MLRDKDVAGILDALAPMAERIILPRVRTERAVRPDDVVEILSAMAPTLQHSIAPSVSAALESARATPGRILLTGSLHFAGEALALLEGNPDALEDCAQ